MLRLRSGIGLPLRIKPTLGLDFLPRHFPHTATFSESAQRYTQLEIVGTLVLSRPPEEMVHPRESLGWRFVIAERRFFAGGSAAGGGGTALGLGRQAGTGGGPGGGGCRPGWSVAGDCGGLRRPGSDRLCQDRRDGPANAVRLGSPLQCRGSRRTDRPQAGGGGAAVDP